VVAHAHAGWVEDAGGKTIIHVKLWQLPDPALTDTATRAQAAVVKEFVHAFPQIFAERYRDKYKANPRKYGRHNWDNVEIELHQFTGILLGGVDSMLLAIAGRVSPDVMYVNPLASGTYIREGFLYPLDKPEDGYLTALTAEEKRLRIHPKIEPIIHREGPDGDMHTWALPFGGTMGKVALYRKEVFDKAGLPYPDNDWTWDDFIHACRVITDPAREIYGVRFGRGKMESWNWLTFLWSAGGDAMVRDKETGDWKLVFDSREAAVALDFYLQLCTEPWIDKDGHQRRGYAYRDTGLPMSEKWQRGEVAVIFGCVDEHLMSRVNPETDGMAPVPLGPTGIRGSEVNNPMMGLFAGIEDPIIRDAAWEYMRFYECREALEIRTRMLVEGGMGRFVNPKFLEMFGYSELIRLAPKGWAETYEIAIETSVPEPHGTNSSMIYEIMTEPMHKAEDLARKERLPEDREERLDFLQGLLQEGVKKGNEVMLGVVSPRERTKRRVSAFVVLVLIILSAIWIVRKVVSAFAPPDSGTGEIIKTWDFRRYKAAYLMLLPAIASIFVWQYYPLARGSVMAFQDVNIMGGSRWVWLDNFGDILWNRDWWVSIWNSLRYSILVISLTFLPPVILAILLQEVPRGRLLFRTMFYLPATITGLVIILLWKVCYGETEYGPLNAIVMRIPAIGFIAVGALLAAVALSFAYRLLQHKSYLVAGIVAVAAALLFYTPTVLSRPIFAQEGVAWYKALFMTLPEPYRWLGDRSTAMFACVLPMAWAGMGPGCLIYLAALKGIAEDFYEAADLDGATFIDKIMFVVFPILKPLIIINFVGVFIGSWKAAGNILVMSGGAADTEVAGLHIFYKAYIHLLLGPATAMAWTLGLMLIGFTVYQLRILSRIEFRTTGDKK